MSVLCIGVGEQALGGQEIDRGREDSRPDHTLTIRLSLCTCPDPRDAHPVNRSVNCRLWWVVGGSLTVAEASLTQILRRGEAEHILEPSVLSAPICCELKIALKDSLLKTYYQLLTTWPVCLVYLIILIITNIGIFIQRLLLYHHIITSETPFP